MANLSVNYCGVNYRNPLVLASATPAGMEKECGLQRKPDRRCDSENHWPEAGLGSTSV